MSSPTIAQLLSMSCGELPTGTTTDTKGADMNGPVTTTILLACTGILACGAPAESAWVEVARSTALDGVAGDNLGRAVDLDGDTLVVGSNMEDVGANQDQGSARIFQRAPAGHWIEVATLVASDGAPGDLFGSAVAIAGDTVVVGAHANGAGAAYVFAREEGGPGSWGQLQKLVASDGQAGDEFGGSVAVDGDLLVVGARYDDVGGHVNQGSAYVFERSTACPAGWVEIRKLVASDGGPTGDSFGNAVAVSGDTVLAGAYVASIGGVLDQGAAYVYQRHQGGPDNWGEVRKLVASDGSEANYFGYAVALDGDSALVGAFNKHSARGTAYVFARHHGGADAWGQVRILDVAQGGDRFAYSVAIAGDVAVAGAPATTGPGGPQQGAAYVFARDAGGSDNWGLVNQLTLATGMAGDNFGFAVAAMGSVVVSGALGENVGANVDQGAVYIFMDDTTGCGTGGCLVPATTCQRQISSSSRRFRNRLYAVLASCRKQIQRGETPLTPGQCDTDPGVGSATARARAALRRTIAAQCTDEDLALLSGCASTLDGLVTNDGSGGCLVEGLYASVLTDLQLAYGY